MIKYGLIMKKEDKVKKEANGELEGVLVFHKTNTSGDERENGETWITYWERITNKQFPEMCPCCEKTLTQIRDENPGKKVEMVGAHIRKYYEYADNNAKSYITPTCNICNNTYKKKVSLEDKKLFRVSEDSLIEAKEKD